MDITAQTRVGALLDAHPELEDPLIALVPAFAKLKKPIVVLRSDFEPAPLLAQVGQEGLLAACLREGSRYRTALRRA